MVSIVKDKTDLDSWFSAKPIIVGNLRTSLQVQNLISDKMYKFYNKIYYKIYIVLCTYRGVVETLSVSM